MENLIQYGLFAYLIINFCLTFFWPSYRVWKRTGVFPVTFSNSDNAHDYVGKVFKTLLFLLLATGAVYTFYPAGMRYLMPVWYLEGRGFQIAGMIILFVALAWIAVAQYQMSDSWRIGIDEKNDTDLVTAGVFSISRNPIFLGMLSTLSGLFLVMPNAVTFAVLLAAFITVQVQVRLEETFLAERHGEDYARYCAKTRRWL